MITVSNKTLISGTILGTMSGTIYSFQVWLLMLLAGPDPVVHPPRPPKPRQWFGWWTPNGWGWTPWFWGSRAFTIPYTLIVPDIVYYITPNTSLSRCNSDKRHSLTATAINDLITAFPDHLPRSRFFTMGASIFTSLTRVHCWASSKPAYTRAAVATFSWPTRRRNWSGRGTWSMSCDGTTYCEIEFVGAAREDQWTWIYWKSNCSETE